MTSTIKADVVEASTTNGNVTLRGNGTGTVAIGDNTAITGTATVSSTLGVTGATTLSGQAYPTAGGLWSGRNMVQNGAMDVAQRGASFTSVTSTAYQIDRFNYNVSGTVGAATITQASEGPNGFKNSLKIDVTTADASLAAADRLTLFYRFEGKDLQRIKKGTADAEKLVLSFWVKATKTGTNIVELYDHDNTRHCAKSYTVSSSDTWEYKTIEYPADTSGALDDDNGNSISMVFGIACGSDFTSGTLATVWAANVNANRFVGQVNNFDSTSNNFQITGVQLECGDEATPFEYEDYAKTLQKCQRYYIEIHPKLNSTTVRGYSQSGISIMGRFQFPTTMRAEPTCAVVGTWSVSNCGQPSFSTFDVSGFTISAAASGTGQTYFFPDDAAEYLTASAEL